MSAPSNVDTVQPPIVDTFRRRNYGRNHAYYLGQEKLIGVTTALSKGFPKPALPPWAARTVAEYVADASPDHLDVLRTMGRNSMVNALKEIPWTQRDAAALRGTDLHNLAEKLINGERVDVPDQQAGLVQSVVAFMNDWKPVPVLVEKTVGSRRWKYAGTFDLIADLPDGRRVLFDYKTSKSGIWPETAMQLAAYRHADCYLDTGPAGTVEIPMDEVGIDECMAVWVRTDGYDVKPLNTDEDPVFRTFLAALFVARQNIAPDKDTRPAIEAWVRRAVRP